MKEGPLRLPQVSLAGSVESESTREKALPNGRICRGICLTHSHWERLRAGRKLFADNPMLRRQSPGIFIPACVTPIEVLTSS